MWWDESGKEIANPPTVFQSATNHFTPLYDGCHKTGVGGRMAGMEAREEYSVARVAMPVRTPGEMTVTDIPVPCCGPVVVLNYGAGGVV